MSPFTEFWIVWVVPIGAGLGLIANISVLIYQFGYRERSAGAGRPDASSRDADP